MIKQPETSEEHCARVDLEAALKNERAIAVYEKYDFQKVGKAIDPRIGL